MKRVPWKLTVRGAQRRLRKESMLIDSWAALWTSPFYAWLRVYVMRKEHALIDAEAKQFAVWKRGERIERRYFS